MFEQILTYILIGASLSVDAFAVSVGEGLTGGGRLRDSLGRAAYFGAFQFLMPVLGFYLAGTISGQISAAGPYISFGLLAVIGGKMLYEALTESGKESEAAGFSHAKTLLLALATSIDALAVGVSFAFTEGSVWLPAAIIGLVTFVLCVLGGLLCAKLPKGSGKVAGIVGGCVLIGIGVKLLLEGVL